MQTKCAIARKVADEGIAVWIANGKREGILTSLVFNPEAACFTCFEPAQ
jgi:glutamate 5-kinase